jgi:hypothetical protein
MLSQEAPARIFHNQIKTDFLMRDMIVVGLVSNNTMFNPNTLQIVEQLTDDILKIERELNRTQSEIDRLEGRMKYLNSQVNYASIELSAEKQTTYGPLGYFFMGIWWGVEKLFIWDQ